MIRKKLDHRDSAPIRAGGDKASDTYHALITADTHVAALDLQFTYGARIQLITIHSRIAGFYFTMGGSNQTEDSDEPSDDLRSTNYWVRRKGYPPNFNFREFEREMVELRGRLKKFDPGQR